MTDTKIGSGEVKALLKSLGLSVVVLGLIIWLVILLVKDPKGAVTASLLKKK